jgi:hypothetical protein
MEKNSFFKTKEGGLTLAFIVIMIAFSVYIPGQPQPVQLDL